MTGNQEAAGNIITKDRWWKGVYPLAGLGFALRVIYALVSDNIDHPDELFQYLEQAHRAVFGYGIIPYEYRFGLRSWITPGFLSIWLYILKLLGLDNTEIYIPLIKIICCVLSTSVIFSSYSIAKRLSSEIAGRLAAFLAAFWYELVYFAPRPLTDNFSGYAFLAAMACALAPSVRRRPILFGILAGLSFVIRIQIAPALTILCLFVLFSWSKKELIQSGVSLLSVFVLAGILDYFTWGAFLISYYNSFQLVMLEQTYELLAAQHWARHFGALGIASAGIFAAAALLGLTRLRKLWLPYTCAASLLFFYTLITHKPYRFLFTVVLLLLIITAVVLSEWIYEHIALSKRKWAYRLSLVLIIVVSVLGIQNQLPLENKVYAFTPLYARTDSLEVYRFLSQQKDVAAVYESSKAWWKTGGYYYLHHDVPLYYGFHLKAFNKEIDKYVSHIICTRDATPLSGFTTIFTFGTLEVRKQTHPPLRYERVPGYGRNIFQKGIDDKYKPNLPQ